MMINFLLKSIKFIIFVVILFTNFGCDFKPIGTVENINYYWYKWDSLETNSHGFLYDSIFQERRLFQYLDSDSSLMFRLDIKMASDTVIFYNGVRINKKDSYILCLNDQNIFVDKYLYDEVDKNDEESYIFLSLNSRIFKIEFIPWGRFILLEGEKTTEDLKGKLSNL